MVIGKNKKPKGGARNEKNYHCAIIAIVGGDTISSLCCCNAEDADSETKYKNDINKNDIMKYEYSKLRNLEPANSASLVDALQSKLEAVNSEICTACSYVKNKKNFGVLSLRRPINHAEFDAISFSISLLTETIEPVGIYGAVIHTYVTQFSQEQNMVSLIEMRVLDIATRYHSQLNEALCALTPEVIENILYEHLVHGITSFDLSK